MSNRWDLIRVSLARRFFLAGIGQATVVLMVTVALCHVLGRQAPAEKLRLPIVFVFSTVFLATGSWFLERACVMVRRERQTDFRRSLLLSLSLAMAFVSLQGYGLWAIDKGVRTAEEMQIGVHGFVIMLTSIHAMHFIVAQLVLLWVTLSAFADRYDHEYSWGVTFAAWCWHALGAVWLGILFIFTMAFAG